MVAEPDGRLPDQPEQADDPDRAGRRFAWEDLIDGRLHRLRRGVDYTGSTKALTEDAQNTAMLLGKVAATYKDELGRHESLWVQFLDGKLQPGDACPACRGRSLERVQGYFLRCLGCGALYALASPAVQETEVRAEAARIKSIVRGKFRAPEDERFPLGAYTSIEFLDLRREPRREHFFGRAEDPTGMPVLLWARYPIPTRPVAGGDQDAERGGEGGPATRGWRICRWPVAPFGSLIRLDRVPRHGSSDPEAEAEAHRSRERRDRRLHFLSEVTLLHEESLPGRERFFGHALDGGGEPSLIYVDYPLINGARVKDPDDPAGEVHTVYHWPAEPFGPMIDLGALKPRPG